MTEIGQTNQTVSEQVPSGAILHNLANIPPTVAEISHLWSTYMAESMACCFQKHIIVITKDPDYLSILQSALDLSSRNLSSLENIFNSMLLFTVLFNFHS